MRIISRFAQWLFILCLPVLAITASIGWAVNSSQFYTYRFEKYDVKQSLAEAGLALTDGQLKDIATGFIHYFNSNEELIHLTVVQDSQSVELFNHDEILHFKDVKGLFRLDYCLLLGTFTYCLIYALASVFWRQGKHRQRLARSMVTGSALTLGLMLLLGIGIMLDFDSLFYSFHLISFSNEFWSAAGNMLLLFPQGFWFDAVIYCAIFTAVVALVLGIIGGIYIVKVRRNERDKHPQSNSQ
jgi:integral membrane protein (TIGR01906 family)